MSNSNNTTIVFASILGAILATGLLALNPSMVGAQQQYGDHQYGYDNNNHQKKSSHTNIQKIKCINSNINVNGIDITQIPTDDLATAAAEAAANEGTDATGTQNGNGLGDRLNVERNLVNVCVNVNANEQVKVEPVPPEEPTTATLTVNKEIFGCTPSTNFPAQMNCNTLTSESSWLPCATDPSISSTPFCQELPPNFFDIEVLDDQTLIDEFEGSTTGTTIPNLQPGTYTVNEIESTAAVTDTLLASPTIEQNCLSRGFDGGGFLLTSPPSSVSTYSLCFEYEDEQGNDCSDVTLAAAEDKTCTVKNYISLVAEPH